MAHEIDMSNNRANMAFVGETPWHGLGSKLSEGASIEKWKKEAGLAWDANSSEVLYRDADAKVQKFEDRFVIYRSDTGAPLSIVSEFYQPVQPGDVLEFFRDLVGELGGFELHTAGSLKGGKKIWALARANDEIRLGNEDVVGRYLLLATSYDKSMATVVQQTSIRVVCANTLGMAYALGERGQETRMSISHMLKFDGDAVKNKLALDKEWSTFTKIGKLLARTKVTPAAQRMFFLDTFYPEPERESEDFNPARADRTLAEMESYVTDSPGSDLSSARGTAWGLLNAVTYYTDHKVGARSNDTRLDKAWFGSSANLKDRALVQALALC